MSARDTSLPGVRRLAVCALALLASCLFTLPSRATAAPADTDAGLNAAVAARLDSTASRAVAAATATRIKVTRHTDAWAFGTAVLATAPGSPRLPEGRLFLAQRGTSGWRVTFDGEPAFTRLARSSPLMNTRERSLLSTGETGRRTMAGGDFRTGMALPYATGQSWTMAGGPHGWSGAAAPWSSLDFAGGDQIVRAVRSGTAYTMCTGWIRVLHDRGYATDYYHLWDNITADGRPVSAGAFLGHTGTDVTCGGAASGRHVHFGLRHNDAYTDIAGHNLGKWVLQNGGGAYQGSALHGSRRVTAGGALYNHGPLGFTQGVVDANGGAALTRRTGPGTGYATAGSLADGATVTISCSRTGTTHTGRWGTTAWWHRLDDGTWVSDAFVWTGVDGPVNGTC
ncbi:peptidoglycan DD-metalloendopeptidase family protein [Streptomyces sp. NPDC056296]|uniref:peptidoglycan DD-metalloendopeptidase family protein n=1 Tax=Streptomyces sp. NPDC056296 TaxID=3345775 RepID=UPI0035E2E2C1